MYYTYKIQSERHPQKTYIGWTNDLKDRIAAHNEGSCDYTKPFKPWRIIFYTHWTLPNAIVLGNCMILKPAPTG